RFMLWRVGWGTRYRVECAAESSEASPGLNGWGRSCADSAAQFDELSTKRARSPAPTADGATSRHRHDGRSVMMAPDHGPIRRSEFRAAACREPARHFPPHFL